MAKSEEDTVTRFVFTSGVSNLLMVYAEMMQRPNHERTSSGKQIFVRGAVLHGQCAVVFHSPVHQRYAWVVSYRKGGFLMWFGDERAKDEVLLLAEDNIVPNPLTCRSLIHTRASGFTQPVEQYVLKGEFPPGTQRVGHFDTLVG